MEDKKTSLIYRIIRWLVWLFYPKTRIVGAENIPQEASVIVGNHTQMNGPIVGELYFPGKKYIWCAGEMLSWKDVHGYAFRDFWSQKPRRTHWFYKILSYLITPLAVCIFKPGKLPHSFRKNRLDCIFFKESDLYVSVIVCTP